jgi:tetratricopeptide (TPR) repeat protein
LVAAICLNFLIFLSRMPADDLGAAVDAFDRDLRTQRIEPDMLNANPGEANAISDPGKHDGQRNSPRPENDRALADLDEAIRLNPNDPLAYANRGDAYRKRRNYDMALSDYDQAIRLNPRSAPAYNNRGNIYLEQRNYDKALSDYNQAIL